MQSKIRISDLKISHYNKCWQCDDWSYSAPHPYIGITCARTCGYGRVLIGSRPSPHTVLQGGDPVFGHTAVLQAYRKFAGVCEITGIGRHTYDSLTCFHDCIARSIDAYTCGTMTGEHRIWGVTRREARIYSTVWTTRVPCARCLTRGHVGHAHTFPMRVSSPGAHDGCHSRCHAWCTCQILPDGWRVLLNGTLCNERINIILFLKAKAHHPDGTSTPENKLSVTTDVIVDITSDLREL